MGGKRYELIFAGRVIPGFARREVIEQVARHLGRDPDNIKRLFRDKPVVIKQNLDLAAASRLQRVFEKMGVICRLNPPEEKPKELPAKDDKPENACPKCGKDLSRTGKDIDDCPFCGIIISKYRALMKPA